MGQKTHPVGFRLGVINTWDSNWYDDKSFAQKLVEDSVIRSYLKKRLEKAGIANINIERTLKKITLTINTSRPGFVIGKSGKEITQLESEIKKITNKEVKINVMEIKKPELNAHLVAENIASQLANRVSFRRAMKSSITSTMRMGAEGIKIMCAGRLGGAEIARTEQYKEGRIPLQTIRADIDYASVTSHTIYGAIGVKVWICRGEKLSRT
ncbi:MAG: 30S ribosomal protein S3 [Ignavibacteria bacterium]|nr:30S ribosomal protein S3 [Ignavibacteria bacterium]MBK6876733.1 30S ribosomal protein S3 [Ignavibacteria bacterium]MBK9229086.1 30S ribosomal protein S3 [Ignavibacteria bacterium]